MNSLIIVDLVAEEFLPHILGFDAEASSSAHRLSIFISIDSASELLRAPCEWFTDLINCRNIFLRGKNVHVTIKVFPVANYIQGHAFACTF